MRRIPATIVTGFLGAGKTSLVRHLLATASGHRLAIVVNEFNALWSAATDRTERRTRLSPRAGAGAAR